MIWNFSHINRIITTAKIITDIQYLCIKSESKLCSHKPNNNNSQNNYRYTLLINNDLRLLNRTVTLRKAYSGRWSSIGPRLNLKAPEGFPLCRWWTCPGRRRPVWRSRSSSTRCRPDSPAKHVWLQFKQVWFHLTMYSKHLMRSL